MGQVQYSDLRKTFAVRGRASAAAQAVHTVQASLELKLGSQVYMPVGITVLGRRLSHFEEHIKTRFNMGAEDVMDSLGLRAPVIQIFRGADKGRSYAYSTYPHVFATSDQDVYVLEVPVGYDQRHFTPEDATAVGKADYYNLGMGNYGIRGVGAVITVPPVLDMDADDAPLPADFDAQAHDWLQLANDPQHKHATTMTLKPV